MGVVLRGVRATNEKEGNGKQKRGEIRIGWVNIEGLLSKKGNEEV